MGTSNLYSEWRAFYTEKVSSWMSLEELRAECGKLTTTDGTSPELLLIHAMHALEECVQRDEALLRQALVRKAAAGETLTAEQGRGLVDVIARYTQAFLWLQRYDEGLLTAPAGSPGGVLPALDEARAAIARLKADLMARGEASDLFGRERGDAFAAILGNLEQTVFGEPAYPSIETKAAHLLYFVIKNHPFSDGNKRTGAFLFVDFLARNGRLLRNGEPIINDVGLAALALLVAESDAKNKDVMIRLIENMLALEALEYYRSGEDHQPTPASEAIAALRERLGVNA